MVQRIFTFLVGDRNKYSLESRLFNVTCIIMFLWTIYDVALLTSPKSPYPPALGYSYSVFMAFSALAYYFGRFKNITQPFVILFWLFSFLGVAQAWLMQAGSHGTIAYIIFPCMIMFIIVTRSSIIKMIMVLVFTLLVCGLVLLEYFQPNIIIQYPSIQDRFIDYLTTVLSAIVMTGIITIYYVGNYRRTSEALEIQKKRIEALTESLKRYLPSQLIESLEDEHKEVSTKPRRVRITVFFSDIKNFTPLTDSMEPEDLTKLINDYFT